MTDKDIVFKLMEYQFDRNYKENDKHSYGIIGLVKVPSDNKSALKIMESDKPFRNYVSYENNNDLNFRAPNDINEVELKLITSEQLYKEILTKPFKLFDIDHEARPYIILEETK